MFARLSGYLATSLNLYTGPECIPLETWMSRVSFTSKMWLFWILRMVKEKATFPLCGGSMAKNKRWSGIFKNLLQTRSGKPLDSAVDYWLDQQMDVKWQTGPCNSSCIWCRLTFSSLHAENLLMMANNFFSMRMFSFRLLTQSDFSVPATSRGLPVLDPRGVCCLKRAKHSRKTVRSEGFISFHLKTSSEISRRYDNHNKRTLISLN